MQGRDARLLRRLQCRAGAVSAHAYGYFGLEIPDYAARHVQRLAQLDQHADVAQQVLAVESSNGESLDGVTRSRHAFHFHAVVGADKEDVGVKTPAQRVGDGEGREDVSARAASRYQYLGFVSGHFMIWM